MKGREDPKRESTKKDFQEKKPPFMTSRGSPQERGEGIGKGVTKPRMKSSEKVLSAPVGNGGERDSGLLARPNNGAELNGV